MFQNIILLIFLFTIAASEKLNKELQDFHSLLSFIQEDSKGYLAAVFDKPDLDKYNNLLSKARQLQASLDTLPQSKQYYNEALQLYLYKLTSQFGPNPDGIDSEFKHQSIDDIGYNSAVLAALDSYSSKYSEYLEDFD